MATPAVSQMIEAPIASEIVTGRSETISDQTGSLLMNEKPRHGALHCCAVMPVPYVRPTKMPFRNSQYWVQNGSLRPSFFDTAATVAGLGLRPA